MTTPKTGSFLSRVSPPQWAALVIAVLAIVFVAQNRNKVSISLFWVTVESPMWLTLTIIFAIGWLVGVLTMRRRRSTKA